MGITRQGKQVARAMLREFNKQMKATGTSALSLDAWDSIARAGDSVVQTQQPAGFVTTITEALNLPEFTPVIFADSEVPWIPTDGEPSQFGTTVKFPQRLWFNPKTRSEVTTEELCGRDGVNLPGRILALTADDTSLYLARKDALGKAAEAVMKLPEVGEDSKGFPSVSKAEAHDAVLSVLKESVSDSKFAKYLEASQAFATYDEPFPDFFPAALCPAVSSRPIESCALDYMHDGAHMTLTSREWTDENAK